jgi:succinate dehydrogenase/fumarate reductase iron-sulfur protein
MNKRVYINRSGTGGRPKVQGYTIETQPELTVLDALFTIQQQQDPTVAFRCSCRVGMCGTCGIQINGVPRLACKTRLNQIEGNDVFLAPLPHLQVIRDLVVSLSPFFEQWKKVLPRIRPRDPESNELAIIPENSAYAKYSQGKRDCLTCGLCFAACGVLATSKQYLGPAAINKALLRVLDPRDTAKEERMQVLDSSRDGVWRCHTQFNCVVVCPKGIDLTESIGFFKRRLLLKKLELES